MFLKNKNIIFKIRRSKVTDYAALNIMFKLLLESKYLTELFFFLIEYTAIIYVKFIRSSKKKTSFLQEKTFEKYSKHFVSDSIFERLKLKNLS